MHNRIRPISRYFKVDRVVITVETTTSSSYNISIVSILTLKSKRFCDLNDNRRFVMHFKTIYLLCILEARSIGILLAYCLDLNDIILLCCKKVSLLRAHFIRIKLSANLPFLNRINNYIIYNDEYIVY